MLDLTYPSEVNALAYPAVGRDFTPGVGVVIKASCRFPGDTEPGLSATAPEIQATEQFAGDPACSPLIASGEAVPWKRGCDVLVHGSAQPPPGARGMAVTCALGDAQDRPLWSKILWVFGERPKRRMGGFRDPEPCSAPIPITYALAYGGPVDGRDRYAANPAGCGHRPYFWSVADRAPQIEWPGLRRPWRTRTPAGFGPIASSWEPRGRRFGRIDEQAAEQGKPLYRKPPQPNAFNAAPDDQQLPRALRGDERIAVTGMIPGAHPRDPVTWALPGIAPRVALMKRARSRRLECSLDTLIIDTDAGEASLVWRTWLSAGEAEQVVGASVELDHGQG